MMSIARLVALIATVTIMRSLSLFTTRGSQFALTRRKYFQSLEALGRSRESDKGSLGSLLIEKIMDSPLYYPIVRQARNTMVKTAESCGIEWRSYAKTMEDKIGDQFYVRVAEIEKSGRDIEVPDYFLSKFHGYELGNLCIDAAIEQEIAGKAVGARNYPSAGADGENILRGNYDREIKRLLGQSVIDQANKVVDLGCGTGTSTRRLASLFPNADSIVGLDLSPHMLAVGEFLQAGGLQKGDWVQDIEPDQRISFAYRAVEDTKMESASVDVVSACLLIHEMPREAILNTIDEALRILKLGGSLLIMEMDPSAPGYIKLRKNKMLFTVLRSTEPYLDDYFDFAITDELVKSLTDRGLSVKIAAGSSRHFVITATKPGGILWDLRPSDEQREQSDEHLNTMVKTVALSG